MKNENPKNALVAQRPWNAQRLEDRLANVKAGKSLQIVVQGICKVCKRRSAAVPATKNEALAWFVEGEAKGFRQYEVRMLTTGVHRACQKVQDDKAKAKPARKNEDVFAVPFDGAKVERIMARRNKRA